MKSQSGFREICRDWPGYKSGRENFKGTMPREKRFIIQYEAYLNNGWRNCFTFVQFSVKRTTILSKWCPCPCTVYTEYTDTDTDLASTHTLFCNSLQIARKSVYNIPLLPSRHWFSKQDANRALLQSGPKFGMSQWRWGDRNAECRIDGYGLA